MDSRVTHGSDQIPPVPREAVGVAPLLDGEELRPVAAVQLLEAVHRHAGGARHELKESEGGEGIKEGENEEGIGASGSDEPIWREVETTSTSENVIFTI